MERPIFLSYSWNKEDSKYIEEIDSSFAELGIQLQRDIRDIDYKDSIEEFMNQIRESEAVITVISNSYLKSRNCMYELIELYKDKDFKNKIFPIILPKTVLFDVDKMIDIYDEWKKKYEVLEERLRNMSTRDIGDLHHELEVLDEIVKNFNSVTCNIRKLNTPPYAVLKKDRFLKVREKMQIKPSTVVSISSDFEIDESKHLLDQVYEAVEFLHREVDFYPLHLLAKQYPFSLKKGQGGYYDSYTLNTNNPALLELFKDITKKQITNTEIIKIQDYRQKIKYILDRLVSNRVFNIQHRSTRVCLDHLYKRDSNDILSLINTYSYIDSYNQLTIDSLSSKQLLKYAYAAYRLGKYILSTEYLFKAYDLVKTTDNNITKYIVYYNLIRLKEYLFFSESEPDRIKELTSRITKIKPKKKISELSQTEYINWIDNNLFYHSKNEKLNEIQNSITGHYYSQLKGGTSHNQHIKELWATYDELIAFINGSYLFFEHFSNMSTMTSLFLQSAFASYAISETGGTRLQAFDDFSILNIIDYAKTEDIEKYLNRYALKELHYEAEDEKLKCVIDNFFSSSDEINKNRGYYKFNSQFWQNHSRIFSNILTLVPSIDFDQDYIDSFTLKLLTFLEEEELLVFIDYRVISRYFYKISSRIGNDILDRYVELVVSRAKYQETDSLDRIASIYSNINQTVSIKEDFFFKIRDYLVNYYESEDQAGDPNDYVDFIERLESEKYKDELVAVYSKGILKRFNFRLFVNLVMSGLVKDNDILFQNAVAYIGNIERRKAPIPFFNLRTDRDRRIGDFINLVFALDIDFPKELKLKFSSYDKYYEWLLNIDEFDYCDFNPEWLLEYNTCFYYRTFFNSKSLKKALDNVICKQVPDSIKDAYLNIYQCKTWEQSCLNFSNKINV